MARNEMFVTVYRLEVEATRENLDSMENFIKVISDALGTTKLANTALKFFGKEGYNISTLGLLGPFKKLN